MLSDLPIERVFWQSKMSECFDDAGVFLDWCSLYQETPEIPRTPEQAEPFERAKAQSGPPKSPLVKEIETICTYELDPSNPDVMRGGQRTATFLVPDAAYTGDPSLLEMAASRLTRAPNGQLVAVDVRVYDLVYTRVTG